jgi:hypothetical protein
VCRTTGSALRSGTIRHSTRCSELVSYESREFKTNDRPDTKIEWEGVRGSSLIANFQFGYSRQDGNSPFLNEPQIVGRSDLDTEVVTGDNVVAGETSWAGFYHTTGSVSWYRPNWWRGNHEIKGGFDFGYGSTEVWGLTPKDYNYHLRYASGVPDSVGFFNAPVQPGRDLRLFGGYVKDNWTLGRLTLNLGVRYSNEAVHIPPGCREAADYPSEVSFPASCFNDINLPSWNQFVPRLSAAFDLRGDGKTVLKGGFGSYSYMREEALPRRYDPNSIAYAVYKARPEREQPVGSGRNQPRSQRPGLHRNDRPRVCGGSGTYHHTSGDPFARQVRFTGGRTIPFIVLNVDPIGTYRRPHLNVMNIRGEKRFTLPRAQTISVALNLYNAFNMNTVTALQNRSGPEFLAPLSILPPRLAEISASYRF